MDPQKPESASDRILSTIQSYLGNGGFFNPEMMEHDKVRNLIMGCREVIDALRAENARLVNERLIWRNEYREEVVEELRAEVEKWKEENEGLKDQLERRHAAYIELHAQWDTVRGVYGALIAEANYLRPIAEAAHELEEYLTENVGATADWPIEIRADEDLSATKLAQMLTNLQRALILYRSEIQERTRSK